jgi:hypothetical protein
VSAVLPDGPTGASATVIDEVIPVPGSRMALGAAILALANLEC